MVKYEGLSEDPAEVAQMLDDIASFMGTPEATEIAREQRELDYAARMGKVASSNNLVRTLTQEDYDNYADILGVMGVPKEDLPAWKPNRDRTDRDARGYEDYIDVAGHDAVYGGIDQSEDPEADQDRFLDY